MSISIAAPLDQLYIGIDIAAASFDARWYRPGDPLSAAQTFPQTPAGFVALQQLLAATDITPAQTLVVLEATGSYWVPIFELLESRGIQTRMC